MSTWHYTRDGQQQSPVSLEQLQQMAASGQLRPGDMVWKEGMSQWQPAAGLPELSPAAIATLPSPAPGQIGYFSGVVDMPPHAVTTFRGYAIPTGPREWPLDDRHMSQLVQAGKYRKPIRNAANAYKALFALVVIFEVIALIVLTAGVRAAPRMSMVIGALPLIVLTGLAILYGFCWYATWRNRRWAPLTMFIVFLLGIAWNLTAVMLGNTGPEGILIFLLISIIPAALAISSWRAYANIPRLLAMPTWTQEVLIATGL